METMFNIITYSDGKEDLLGIPPSSPNFRHEMHKNTWEKHIEYNELFKFISIDKVKPNTKYIIYLSHYQHFLTDNFENIYNFYPGNKNPDLLRSEVPMLERIWKDSGNGLVHWIVDWGTECFQLEHNAGIHFKKLCVALNTIPKNITLITGAETNGHYGNTTVNTAVNHGYNCVTGYELFKFLLLEEQEEEHTNYTLKKIKDIANKNILKYKSLCYNRLPRHHRTVIVAHILKNKYHNNCLYSLGTFPNEERWHWQNYFPELSAEIDHLKSGPEIYPHIREKFVNLQENQAHQLGWEHGLNSYFQLVTETTPGNARYPFITEKSLKPLAMLQPFIQYGPKNNIKVLRTHGFDTFDKWIDHSYDDEEDDVQRLRLVLKEFDRLQAITSEDWSNILKEMLPSLLHNCQLIKKPVSRNITSQLIPILIKFMEENNNV